ILKQVHGTGIVDAAFAGPGCHAPQGSDKGSVEGDGWVCAQKGVTPAVYISDCLPIFMWDLEQTAVGVFHAGWRGLAAGMPRAAVRAFGRIGLGPERLAAAVGPHVGACCYRVGPDVAAKFRAGVLRDGLLDLGAEARLQLEESGLAGERISVSPACTACEPSEFFSYRRDKLDRRLLAFITLPEATV
ncbi:MAG: polyphenol oxidase family protein, partial [Elusimicrobia bacterium]|nr:polyphenol oxidase family protein [Elusimicrobiota bacterium]